MHMNRRRFIAISAAAVGISALPAYGQSIVNWQGIALGASASISLAHPDADAIIARAVAEISRLESVFSLYREDSALAQLNAAGHLTAPPFELLECLALCARVHEATGGMFDPTVQPLWALYAESFAKGDAPDASAIAATLPLVRWEQVHYDSAAIQMPTGMQLTLNGIAQGYIADRVADLLHAEGLTDVLINTGELRALGGSPLGGGWPVQIEGAGKITLQNGALASSAPLGTVFDLEGRVGHILNPRTGTPTTSRWRLISIAAPSAALADALSTAGCLQQDRLSIEATLAGFANVELRHLS